MNSKYEQQIFNQEFGRCFDCNQSKTSSDWCRKCNTERFQMILINGLVEMNL
jgi:hypothetical protein